MIRRVVLAVAALSALATMAATAVVAAAYALYLLLKDSVGAAGAAGIVAGAAIVLVALAGLVVGLRGKALRKPEPEPSVTDTLFKLARERPVLAAGGALAAGLLALKNPQIVAGLVSAFLAGKAADSGARRRR